MVINDLLDSNIALRNKIANDLASMNMAIEEPVINNLADSDIDVKRRVINKLIKMNMILTDLTNVITSSEAWSRTTSSAATSTASSPSQTWSLTPPTETPPSEHEEEDPDWPFVGRKGPLPPSPSPRQRDPTPDEVTEEFLSQTLYPLFGLSRHPNPRGLWTLEKNEKAPIPISLGKHTRLRHHQQTRRLTSISTQSSCIRQERPPVPRQGNLLQTNQSNPKSQLRGRAQLPQTESRQTLFSSPFHS